MILETIFTKEIKANGLWSPFLLKSVGPWAIPALLGTSASVVWLSGPGRLPVGAVAMVLISASQKSS